MNGRVQFLLLMRGAEVGRPGIWRSIHGTIEPGESALQAAERSITADTGLPTTDAFSTDTVNPFYAHESDTIILAPVFAFAVPARSHVQLGSDYVDYAWCEREEATARLPWLGQRQAIRHIEEVIGFGGPEAEIYRVRRQPPGSESPLPIV
jgi:hypothetical protein